MRASLLVWLVLVPALAASLGCGSASTDAGPEASGAAKRSAPAAASVSVLGVGVVLDGSHVRLMLRLRQPEDVDPPAARVATLDLPAGLRWREGGAPACPRATVVRHGAGGCPRGAIVGRGLALAAADTATSRGEITVVNGGAGRVLLATVIRHPAYVKAVVEGRVAVAADGRSRLTLTFPEELQAVAGVPLGLQRLALTLDRGRALSVGSCPSSGWPYAARVRFVGGATAAARGRVACRR